MYVLVTYDIQTSTPAGKHRLRRAAQTCLNFGQRVQYSVFELKVDPAQWAVCKDRLLQIIDLEVDSIRFYYLGTRWDKTVEHHGVRPGYDLEGPLVF